MKPENAIEVKDLHKSFKVYFDKGAQLKERMLFWKRNRYERRHVLKGISFDVKKGEAIGLIGHNGCGKSTTLKLLTRIIYPDSGTIEMQGRVASLIELGAGFHPDMSGRENIYINASIFGLNKRDIEARLQEIIAFSGLEEYIDNPVRTYSSGMYMRLAFSVAINVDADILLVDEILAVGDVEFQRKCLKKLQSLKANGVTIVIVSHDMNSIKSFCNRCIWIHEGIVMRDGETMEAADAYLSYMSRKRTEGEKGQEHEQEEGADNEDDSDVHFGNRKVILKKAEFLNASGKSTNVLNADEPFSIRYHYEVRKPVEEMNVGMGIFDSNGVWIFGTNTVMANQRVKVNEQEGILVFECEPLRLLSGEYRLQVALVEMNGDPMDYYQDYLRFSIVNPYQESGLVHYDTKWTIS